MLILLGGGSLGAVVFAENDPAAAPAVPAARSWADMILPREEGPVASNALLRWQGLYTPLFSIDGASCERLMDLLSPLKSPRAGDATLRAWLLAQAATLDGFAVREGEHLQFPLFHGPETPMPDYEPISLAARCRVVAMKFAWRDGRHDDALALAIGTLDLARAVLRSQEGLVPMIRGVGLWQNALDGCYWLARQRDLKPADAARLRVALEGDSLLAAQALNRSFRGEFTFVQKVIIERLPVTNDIERILSSIGSLGMEPPSAPEEGEPRVPVSARPLLDADATLGLLADGARAYLDALAKAPRRFPRGVFARELQPVRERNASAIPSLLRYATGDEPISPEMIAGVGTELDSVENPAGKLYALIATPAWEPLVASALRREAARSALVGLLAWRCNGKPLPWEALLENGQLESIPQDPFAGTPAPLRVSVKRFQTRAWSVGLNGTDEGGRGDGENYGQPDDFTWPASFLKPRLLKPVLRWSGRR